MDLVTLPFRLPFLPIQGLVRVAELIQDEAEAEYRNPAAVRRQLEEAEEANAQGEISPEAMYQAQVEAIERVAEPAREPGGVLDPAGSASREADPVAEDPVAEDPVAEDTAADASAEEE
jgi:hypothetical protein